MRPLLILVGIGILFGAPGCHASRDAFLFKEILKIQSEFGCDSLPSNLAIRFQRKPVFGKWKNDWQVFDLRDLEFTFIKGQLSVFFDSSKCITRLAVYPDEDVGKFSKELDFFGFDQPDSTFFVDRWTERRLFRRDEGTYEVYVGKRLDSTYFLYFDLHPNRE